MVARRKGFGPRKGAAWKSNRRQFEAILRTRVAAVHDKAVEIAYGSIVEGSALTGAPGQPRDLRDGQWGILNVSPNESVIAGRDPSIRSVEDMLSYKRGGVPLKKLKSDIGGGHSVKLTAQRFDKIAEAAVMLTGGKG